jgi:putative tricarboxylic transport membrane protein
MRSHIVALIAFLAFHAPPAGSAGAFEDPECIAPAKPGGGFDVTCKLVQTMLLDAKAIKRPMRVTYIPGGIGAVAYNVIVAQRPAEPNVVVAFSSGSLLNLAQGKFGAYSERDVRWVAAIGADYGAIVVSRNSTINSLRDLEMLLKRDASKVVFGGGGTVGSQDWMKAALSARALGVDFKSIRFVAFEGGGEALKALRGGHIQVFAGDAAETLQQIEAGTPVRIIAVLSEKRLGGKLKDIPTAREQGYDVQWPIVRGIYLGPKVGDADYVLWVEAFRKAMTTNGYSKLLEERGLTAFPLTGESLQNFIEKSVAEYRKMAAQFGLQLSKNP